MGSASAKPSAPPQASTPLIRGVGDARWHRVCARALRPVIVLARCPCCCARSVRDAREELVDEDASSSVEEGGASASVAGRPVAGRPIAHESSEIPLYLVEAALSGSHRTPQLHASRPPRPPGGRGGGGGHLLDSVLEQEESY